MDLLNKCKPAARNLCAKWSQFTNKVNAWFDSRPGFTRMLLSILSLVSIVIYAALILLNASHSMQRITAGGGRTNWQHPSDSTELASREATIQDNIRSLSRQLERSVTRNPFFVVNTSENVFRLYSKGELIRQGKCSTGSYIMLHGEGEQKWIFRTPRGEYSIQGKIEAPVWRKPDWAFVEEGLPVPPQGHPSRYERGVLGDYALSLGSGYLIHGTLYQRFLGLPVTHGCIRLGDDDLEAVYNTLKTGYKVYIY